MAEVVTNFVRSPCYASERKWYAVQGDINGLRSWARKLMRRADAIIRTELYYVMRDLDILEEDLHAWRPNEAVCWGEFDRKIASIEARLRSIQRMMEVRVRI